MAFRPFAQLRRTPWKNGGGETAELAVWPTGAGFDDFDARVSMALVASDGPFSTFAGVDRTLAILDGAGLVLDVAGAGATLTRESLPFAFAGDVTTHGRLVGGPILDLNVMTRRGRWTHRVRALDVTMPTEVSSAIDGATIVVCLDKTLVIDDDLPGLYDAAIYEHGDGGMMEPTRGRARVYLIELAPVA